MPYEIQKYLKYKIRKYLKLKLGSIALYLIQALKSFNGVKAGDLGGCVEKEGNLCQNDNCWVCKSVIAWGGGRVYGNAQIYGTARFSEDVQALETARILPEKKSN